MNIVMPADALSQLRVNPEWASLPLFDRTGWTRVRFGDVVQNCNESCDPVEAGLDRFIAMEHLEPGSLQVSSWGNVSDGTTFTRRCRPGQVLFGRRRAYQRKVAVADFDAVVSGDIYVLTTKDADRLLPDLLPFICLSEGFFQHAVGTSAGSLSPRTKWDSLASFEFDLPPLEQQRRIAGILCLSEDGCASSQVLVDRLQTAYGAKSNATFRALGADDHAVRRFNSVVQMQTGPFGTVLAASSYERSGIPVVNPVNMVGDNFDTSNGPFVTERDAHRLAKYRIEEGDIVLCRKRHVGRMVFATSEHVGFVVGSDCIRFRTDPKKLNRRFLLMFLRSPAIQRWLIRSTTGTVMPGISEAALSRLELPVPSLSAQLTAVAGLQFWLDAGAAAEKHRMCLHRLRASLVDEFSSERNPLR